PPPRSPLFPYTTLFRSEPLEIRLRSLSRSGIPFHVRDYQRQAADVFYAGGDAHGGSGVIVLPCGAGKTIVGLAAMALVQRATLRSEEHTSELQSLAYLV